MQLILQFSVAALLVAIGLHSRVDDLLYVWRRPGLLVRSLLAIYVIVPLVSFALVRALEIPRSTEIAIMVLAICAGAPLLPRKLARLGGNPSYVFSLVVTTSLLAIVTVPASVHLLASELGVDLEVTAVQIALLVVRTLLVPLIFGMVIHGVAPAFAERLGHHLLNVAGLVLAATALIALARGWRQIVDLGMPSLLAFAAFTAVALICGHLLGGPDPLHRTSLAMSSASRHVGLALVVAASARSEKVLALVLGYVLVSSLVTVVYIKLYRRRLTRKVSRGDASA